MTCHLRRIQNLPKVQPDRIENGWTVRDGGGSKFDSGKQNVLLTASQICWICVFFGQC